LEPEDGEDRIYVCSLCLMYGTRWGRTLRPSIEEAVRSVESSRDVEFDKDEGGRLIVAKDGDDVLGVIVLSDRFAFIQSRHLLG